MFCAIVGNPRIRYIYICPRDPSAFSGDCSDPFGPKSLQTGGEATLASGLLILTRCPQTNHCKVGDGQRTPPKVVRPIQHFFFRANSFLQVYDFSRILWSNMPKPLPTSNLTDAFSCSIPRLSRRSQVCQVSIFSCSALFTLVTSSAAAALIQASKVSVRRSCAFAAAAAQPCTASGSTKLQLSWAETQLKGPE